MRRNVLIMISIFDTILKTLINDKKGFEMKLLLLLFIAASVSAGSLDGKKVTIILDHSKFKDSLAVEVAKELSAEGAEVKTIDYLPSKVEEDARLFIWQGKKKVFPKKLRGYKENPGVPSVFFVTTGAPSWPIDAITGASKKENISKWSKSLTEAVVKELELK